MLKFMKNFFGFGASESNTASAAPYKIEAPTVTDSKPVVNTPQPMVNGRKTAKAAPARATGNVPAKKAPVKKPVAKKTPAKKK